MLLGVILVEFFGMTDKSTVQELLESSFLRKMKNYCCRLLLFLSIIQIINRNPEPKTYWICIVGDELSYPTHSKTATVNNGLGSVGDEKE